MLKFFFSEEMAIYLKITHDSHEELNNHHAITDTYENRNKPFCNSQVYDALIEDVQTLTEGDDVKTVYHVKFSFKDAIFDFLPGDAIAILPENEEEEVMQLLIRLNLEAVCHNTYSLAVLEGTVKKNGAIPKHLPQYGTLYDVFLKHVDIRRFCPKKLFLKSLIKFTKDSTERERLELICSPSGSQEYLKLLAENRSLLFLLNSFPSCHPPIELILQHSTPLNPRYFSIASSPLSKGYISIIFFVVKLESGLKGICTGWLERIIKNPELLRTKQIPIYFRKQSNFRLTNMDIPSVLVATGTGIAPFLGFLEHIKLAQSKPNRADTWLFYGCRYSTKDFLGEEQLKGYLKEGVLTRLITAFSREGEKKKYVQHRIVGYKQEVTDIILNKKGVIFVCGDIKTVVRDVKEVILDCFMECMNTDRISVEDVLNDLIESGRFLVDTWV